MDSAQYEIFKAAVEIFAHKDITPEGAVKRARAIARLAMEPEDKDR